MIDDDSNELIPFEGGDGDADASTGNNNPDDTQSVTIIQDEQGIVFLGDAGTIDLWLKDEGFDSKAFTAKVIQTVSSASKRRTGSRQRHGRKRTLGKTHQRIG